MTSVRRSRTSVRFNFELRDIIIAPFEGGLWIAQRVIWYSVESHHEEDIIHNRSARADGYSPIERSDTHNNCETYCKYITVWVCRLFALLWILASIYLIMTGLLLHCPSADSINAYAIVQGILNLFFVGLFGVTIVLDKWFYEFYESKLPYIGAIFDFALMFSIAWMVFGSVWVWGALFGWWDDEWECHNALFIGAIIFLCFQYMSFMILCCNCLKCRVSNWCSKFGELNKE